MTAAALTFVTTLRVAAANRAAVEALLADVRDRTHRDGEGIAYYEFARGTGAAGEYVVIEAYRDAGAHAAHLRSDRVTRALPRVRALVEAMDVRRYAAPGAAA